MILNLESAMAAKDEATINALADNMRLAPSNDVLDTKDWLREHAALVGLAGAIEWYAKCATSRERDPFLKQLDWKQGIVDARQEVI